MDEAPRWILEQDVVELLDLRMAIDAIETALVAEARGEAASMTKTHLMWGSGHTLHAIGAVDEARGLVATKTWAHTGGGATPLVVVWRADDGSLCAVIEAFALGQLRTGAVSGVATRWLAQPAAGDVAVIGSGKQALAQLAAIAAVRPVRHARIFSPTAAHRDAFAAHVGELFPDWAVEGCSSVEAAVEGAQVVTTVTRARQPFLTAGMLSAGAHVNAVGAITPERRELADDVIERADMVVVDSADAARQLAAELHGVDEMTRLCDVVGGDGSQHDLTVFKAMGVGLADLALAAAVVVAATETGAGRVFAPPRRISPRLKEPS